MTKPRRPRGQSRTRVSKSLTSTRPASQPSPKSSDTPASPKPKRGATRKNALRLQDPYLERERQKYAEPLPSREFLMQVLREQGVPMWPEELAEMLGIRQNEEDAFMRRLRAMERDGQLMVNRKGAICMADKLDLVPGRVEGHPDGFGFCVPESGDGDLFLSPREMQKVMHGDRVLVRQVGVDRRGKREGVIVEVLERRNRRLVGRVHIEGGVPFVVAEDKRISHEILLPKAENTHLAKPLKAGQVITVDLLQQPSPYAKPIGKVAEILGNYADPGMEVEIALRKHDLPHVFPEDALAIKIPTKVRKADWEGRVDLTGLPLVTIDGETAKDFDDAVYAEPIGKSASKGWRLVVAIADVSHYVKAGSALDMEAQARGNSVYFPRRVIPMLPESLSNGICSLNPQVERLCMVCDMTISRKGEIKDYRFYPAVMFSHARLTYTQVAAALEHPNAIEDETLRDLLPHLRHLDQVYQAFSKERARRGAIDFDTVETQMVFDKQDKIETIVPVVRNEAHKLIEECMLAANVCAAELLLDHKHPALYRNHETPSPDKLEKLREFLSDFGMALPGGDAPTAGDYAKVLEKIRPRPDAQLLQTVLLRSLMQAQYGPENAGHFGLGYDAYAHFTSPIRRYPDLLVHRAIKAVLKSKKYNAGNWTDLGLQCSMTERRADDATRDVTNWLKCYFMQDKVGESFTGTVSAVTGFGLFVLLDAVYVEGLLHISELGRDYFHFDQVRHMLTGEKSGMVYRLGDRVRVKVVRVDMEQSRIDFVLGDEEEEAPPPAKGRRRKAKS